MASGHLPVSEWLHRIRAEYQEMPGLSLNKEQMQKRWGLDAVRLRCTGGRSRGGTSPQTHDGRRLRRIRDGTVTHPLAARSSLSIKAQR
jgi:hypothetical protein